MDRYTSRLVDVSGDSPVTLTHSIEGESLCAIGQRGEVYFASGRTDARHEGVGHALWMLPPSGEARVVVRTVGSIDSVEVAGSRLFITAQALPSVDGDEALRIATSRRDRGVSAILHEDFPVRFWDHDLGATHTALFVADCPELNEALPTTTPPPQDNDGDSTEAKIEAKKTGDTTLESEVTLRRVSLPEGQVGATHASPDGTRVLVTLHRNVEGTTMRTSRVVEVEVASGEVRDVVTSPRWDDPECTDYRTYGNDGYAPDGQRAIIDVSTEPMDGAPLATWALLWHRESGELTRLAPDFDDWINETQWLDDDTIVFTAARRGRQSIYRLTVGDPTAQLITDDDCAYSQIGVADGEIVALRSAITSPPAPVRVSPDGSVRPLPALTPAVEAPGILDEAETTAEDGTRVGAWLWKPEGDTPAPLLVFVHGGPWGSWNDWTWRWNPGPFVERGYAVLLPDPAISTGYGQHMIDRGHDEVGGTPFTDILALVDATVARPDIDDNRTALLGGSYGGYMANWMAGHTGTRFRCIVSHASLWNIDMMGRTTDNGVWHAWMAPTQAARFSPHRFAAEISVPMLIIHGDRDYRVPVSQSHALWHALNNEAKVRGHRFLYFPDENHWVLKPSNSVVWYQTVMAFVDQHVLGKQWKRPELLG